MPVASVIDLSHHNAIPKDLHAARAQGIIGCIHKLSEGMNFVDNKCQARHWLSVDADMRWGLYHFLRPGADMADQAEFFWTTALQLGVVDDETLLAADHEDPKVSYDELIEFLEALERMSGRVPVIYSGHVLKEQCDAYPNKYRLWLAQYAAEPVPPAGCENLYLWQFSDSGHVDGITPPTDLNCYFSNESDFLAAWSGKFDEENGGGPGVNPIPAAPVDITITINVKGPAGTTVSVK